MAPGTFKLFLLLLLPPPLLLLLLRDLNLKFGIPSITFEEIKQHVSKFVCEFILCLHMKNLLQNGRSFGHVTPLKNLEPVYVFRMVKYRNFVFRTTCISHRMTPKVGVVRSRDLILQYNVKVGNKTANISVKNLSV